MDVRTIELPCQQRLTVRDATLADADGLLALYERLGPEDRQRRFFSAAGPGRAFVETWIGGGERGGRCLVVVGADGTIVAEAGYARLPNGDAELALAVDRPWRGWLGPFLLDVLAAAAAADGIPTLEAEVLRANRAMLATVRSRGHAIIDAPDWSTIRVAIGAGVDGPGWPPVRSGPRVLVEGAGAGWRPAQQARDAGLEVITCSGPRSRAMHGCPVLTGGHCPLLDGADLVAIVDNDLDARLEELADRHLADGRRVVRVTAGDDGDEVIARLVRALGDRGAQAPP